VPYQEPEFLPWDGRRVPITFVGGYLGAGKTSAINDLLRHTDSPVAVIVNDVGAINVDAALVRRRHGDTIELTNGCVCCTSIDGLGAAFDQIRARPTPPDHLIIELSGVAEPHQMLPWGQTAGFVLDGMIVVVAADQLVGNTLPGWIQTHIATHVAAADLLILTKTDVVDAATTHAARARLAQLAPGTPVFDGGRDLAQPGAVGRFLSLGARRPGGPTDVADSTLFDAHHVQVVSPPYPATSAELDAWLDTLPQRCVGQLVRAKGIVATTDLGLVAVHIVGARREIAVLPMPEHQPPTGVVVISLNR
jgi:G3E family GTPase